MTRHGVNGQIIMNANEEIKEVVFNLAFLDKSGLPLGPTCLILPRNKLLIDLESFLNLKIDLEVSIKKNFKHEIFKNLFNTIIIQRN